MEENQCLLSLKLSSHSSDMGECLANNLPPSEDTSLMESMEGNQRRTLSHYGYHDRTNVIPECFHGDSSHATKCMNLLNNETICCDTESGKNTEILFSIAASNKTTHLMENKDNANDLKLNTQKSYLIEQLTEQDNLDNATFYEDFNVCSVENLDRLKSEVSKGEESYTSKLEKENTLSEAIKHNDIYPLEIQVEQCRSKPDNEIYYCRSEINIPATNPYMTVLEAIQERSPKKNEDCENEDTLSCKASHSCRIPQIPKNIKDVLDEHSKPRRNITSKNYSSSSANLADVPSANNRRKKQKNSK